MPLERIRVVVAVSTVRKTTDKTRRGRDPRRHGKLKILASWIPEGQGERDERTICERTRERHAELSS